MHVVSRSPTRQCAWRARIPGAPANALTVGEHDMAFIGPAARAGSLNVRNVAEPKRRTSEVPVFVQWEGDAVAFTQIRRRGRGLARERRASTRVSDKWQSRIVIRI